MCHEFLYAYDHGVAYSLPGICMEMAAWCLQKRPHTPSRHEQVPTLKSTVYMTEASCSLGISKVDSDVCLMAPASMYAAFDVCFPSRMCGVATRECANSSKRPM